MVRVIVADKKLDGTEFLGKFVDETNFDVLVEEDCDFYAPVNPLEDGGNEEMRCVFKFRKNVFSKEEQEGAYNGLIEAAGASNNRGIAAGPRTEKNINRDWVTEYQLDVIDALCGASNTLDGNHPLMDVMANKGKSKAADSRGQVWLRSKIEKDLQLKYENFFDIWLDGVIKNVPQEEWPAKGEYIKTLISGTSYANQVFSGIAGFFDRYPRIPYGRVCSYNLHNQKKFELSFPYLRKLNEKFKELLPYRWGIQNQAAASIDKKFLIGEDTVFTTLTVNRTFRTAAHLDAGDLGEGFSNLGVILPPDGASYKGGYLVLPEYRAAVNVRPGDLLLISNHDVIHGNTQIFPADENQEEVIRMSIVAYFRENMKELGTFAYETARKDFVESRRLDKDHPLWKPLWNGVSPGMWDTKEWCDFLKSREGGQEMLQKYHCSKCNLSKDEGLDEFFN